MLSWIRRKSSGVFMTILMGLLILSFGFWGVEGYFNETVNDEVASVNGEKISYSDFMTKFSQFRENTMSQYGDGIDASYFDSPMLKRNFLDSMINAEMLKQIALNNNYTVTAVQIKAIIDEAQVLKDENGEFSMELYASYLAQTNQSAQYFETKLSEGIVSEAIQGLLDQSAFITPAEARAVTALNQQSRSFEYINISPDKFLTDIEPSAEEINQYYDENSSLFMTQEMVAVDYIELNAVDVAASIEITEQDALENYEENKARHIKDAQRLASHILLSVNDNEDEVLKQINDIKVRLDAGESFADLAKELSEDSGSAVNGGDLGWVSPGDMVTEFNDKLFDMEVATVSDPVRSEFGYHLIQLNEIKLPEQAIFEEVRDEIIESLQAKESELRFLELSSELSALVLDAEDSLDAVADNSDYEIKTTELFPRSGGKELAANQDFIKTAFSILVKDELQNSDAIRISDNHIVYMHINQVEDAKVKPLEEVKEQILSAIKSQMANEKVAELASKIANAINNDDKTMTEVAAENQLEVIVAENIQRTGSSQPFPLVRNVFKMAKPSDGNAIVEVVGANGNDQAVVSLSLVSEAGEASTEDIDVHSTQLARSIKTNESQLLINALRESASIYINEKILNQSSE